MEPNMQKILDSLSPNERKILPYLESGNVTEICRKSNLDKISVVRSLEYLKNKKIVELTPKERKVVEIGVNGALYRKKGLPERRLLNLLNEKRILKLENARVDSKLSEDEFKASLGILKRKNIIDLKSGKIIFSAGNSEIYKKTPEEILIESLPIIYETLSKEQLTLVEELVKRKKIVEIEQQKTTEVEMTEFGRKVLASSSGSKELIEQITPEMLNRESLWRGKRFRRYDVSLPVANIHGGKRHFVNQATDYGRAVWAEMGFKEMEGPMVDTSFWLFDVLFTPQDHPAREMQDTFFINKLGILPEKRIVQGIKSAHEGTLKDVKSIGWNYKWNEEEAKKMAIRTHTTSLSVRTLSQLKKEDMPAKFFAIGKNFRNETLDWKHAFEFNQTEGIVVDPKANFRHLIGYLKQFFKKMGFEKIRIRPTYYAYTEPSVGIEAFHPEKKQWIELGGAGIFRPEVTTPLLGSPIPVLAWGPGFDRILMDYYKIQDIRELYKNDITKLRKMKIWMK